MEEIHGPRLGLPPGVDPARLEPPDPAGRSPLVPGGDGAAAAAGSFARQLSGMLADVSRVQQQSSAATEALVRGEPIDLHEVIIRQEEARVAFTLLIETRNKVLEAYNEIMRMGI